MPLLKRILLAIPFAGFAWLAILALVLRFDGNAPGVIVLFPPSDFIERLPVGIAISNSSPISLTLRSAEPNLVRNAYESGAVIVLPAGLQGCLSVR